MARGPQVYVLGSIEADFAFLGINSGSLLAPGAGFLRGTL